MKNHVKSMSFRNPAADIDLSHFKGKNDSRFVLRFILGGYKALLDDGILTDKDYSYVLQRSSFEGLGFVAEVLPLLGKALDRALAEGRLETPSHFRCLRKGGRQFAVPLFMVKHFLKVFTPKGVLLPDPCVKSVRAIRQVCYYAYKADLPSTDEKDWNTVWSFIECEIELSEFVESASRKGGVFHDIDSHPTDPILRYGSLVAKNLLSGFDPMAINPRHGPGITSDVSIPRKWTYRPRLVNGHCISGDERSLLSTYGTYRWFSSNHCFDDLLAIKPIDPFEGWIKPPRTRTARVLLVPKDSRGPRLISAEPSYAQFAQQGIMAWMVDRIEEHPFTRGHVNFADQSVNQKLALEGSLSGDWSTLDLKEASDRVSLRLVDLLFSETGSLLDGIHAVRSSQTRLPENADFHVMPLKKHAPMGSALCFPVMATCIWLILVSGFRAMGISFDEAKSFVYVYGDDIIVPSSLHDVSIRLLERYGLLVNKAKSFRGKGFLESCGCDAFLGEDVTPVRLRKIWGSSPSKGAGKPNKLATPRQEVAVAAVAHGNLLRQQGYWYTSVYWFSVAEYLLRSRLPVIPPRSGLVGIESDCRFDWTVDNGYIRGYRVRSVGTDRPISPWDHFRRSASLLGSGRRLAFGKYDLPRKWKLVKQSIPLNLVPVGDSPDWVIAGPTQCWTPASNLRLSRIGASLP